jgi:hypothetical protein
MMDGRQIIKVKDPDQLRLGVSGRREDRPSTHLVFLQPGKPLRERYAYVGVVCIERLGSFGVRWIMTILAIFPPSASASY